jgi:hypothetical protein
MCNWAQQGLNSGGLGAVAWSGQGPGVLVWCGSGSGLGSSAAEGWVSCWCVDPAQPEKWQSHCAWAQHRAVAWHNPRGREPSRMELWLCRPTGQGFCKWLFFY